MQGGMHRINGPGEAVLMSHHTQPKCRGRRNLNSRRNARENRLEYANYRYNVTHLKHGGAKCFGESTVVTLG